MADWKKRASRISGDVVFFEYVTSKLVENSEVVFVWDIDKTYLDTHFETLRGLIRTALEKAFQKRNIPGTGSLVRAITSSRDESEQSKPFPIYFISASPPQLERRIRAKLELDGIKPYGIFFKDNLRNLRPKYFRRLNKHVGFKLQALLELRTRLRADVKQVLWGDDSESDAIIYSIYSDICARRIAPDDVRHILERFMVPKPQREYVLDLQSQIPTQDPVEKIYINLANDTDPDYYAKFGRRMLATFNTFQVALDLYQDKRITSDQLLRVGQDMIVNYAYTPEQLLQAMDELIRRKILAKESVEEIVQALKKQHLLPARYKVNPHRFLTSSFEDVNTAPWIPEAIDYLNDFR